MCKATVLLTLLYGGCVADGVEILGVAPADQKKYAPITKDGKEHFRCLNDTSGQLLPYSSLNDDFCDCSDASDEPGTSACAGQNITLFFCRNVESVPKYIYSSQVGDMICDCCDGSDELSQSRLKCPNTCAAEGYFHRRKSADRAAMLSKGLRKQRELIATAKAARLKRNEELEKLRSKTPELEAIRDAHKAAFDAATVAWEQEEQRLEEEHPLGEVVSTSEEKSLWDEDEKEQEKPPAKTDPPKESGGPPTLSAEKGSSDPPQPRPKVQVIDDPDPDAEAEMLGSVDMHGGVKSEEKPQVSEYAKWMEGAGQAGAAGEAQASEKPKAGEPASESPQVSEYTKWMEGSEKVISKTSAVIEDPEDNGAPDRSSSTEDSAPSAEEQSEFWKSEKTQGPDLDRLSPSFTKTYLAHASRILMYLRSRIDEVSEHVSKMFFSQTKSTLEQAREVARAKHESAIKELQAQLKKVEELQAQVLKKEDDEHLAYSVLKDTCLSVKAAEYKYEVCFFKDAHQDSTSLGRWKDWVGPHEALFDDGQWCPGGPARQIRVKFACGAWESLEAIEEPSRCQYIARALHPGACVPQEPGADNRPQMPMDEL